MFGRATITLGIGPHFLILIQVLSYGWTELSPIFLVFRHLAPVYTFVRIVGTASVVEYVAIGIVIRQVALLTVSATACSI